MTRLRDRWGPPARLVTVDFGLGVAACVVLITVDFLLVGGVRTVEVLVAVVCSAGLTLRRAAPTAALAIVTVALAVQLVELHQPRAMDAALLISLYSCWAAGGVVARTCAGGIAVASAPVGTTLSSPVPAHFAVGSTWVTAVAYLAVTAAACGLGLLSRTRRALTEQLHIRAERAEADERRTAQLAMEQERARVARDVHDVVAHSLTVIAVQAQASSFAATIRPEVAQPALDSIADTAKTALGDVRDVLRMLRAGPGDPPPLTELLDRARDSGLPVTFSETGQARTLTRHAAHTLHRLVQEALTNTMRHAGSGAHATVELHWHERELHVVVADHHGNRGDIPNPQHGLGLGLGLTGMQERVIAVGGRLDAGPTDDGFHVRATIPAR